MLVFYGLTGWLLMLCFVGRVRELEGLSGECPFEGNQPFGQTPTVTSRAALAWEKRRSPLVVGRAGGSALRLGLDLASKKTKLHVKPRPNVPKCDQMCRGFARSLPGLWRSHIPGKGPALQGLTACTPPCCFLQTKKTGAVPCDRSLNGSLDQRVSCPRDLSVRVSVFLFPQGP